MGSGCGTSEPLLIGKIGPEGRYGNQQRPTTAVRRQRGSHARLLPE
jgi:hypothetical protein